ncbi:hypothetical protein I7I51_08330 [Histoplasma capsulatum]|uniref:Uncharacterized protein n=1 Tax=Ajellomyces capsulatus TaxID=5037 RepID=A0A8A1M0E8_AJECA|nr:hypothetical protein I7I51_08330 [Histoplasma capsulatum]
MKGRECTIIITGAAVGPEAVSKGNLGLPEATKPTSTGVSSLEELPYRTKVAAGETAEYGSLVNWGAMNQIWKLSTDNRVGQRTFEDRSMQNRPAGQEDECKRVVGESEHKTGFELRRLREPEMQMAGPVWYTYPVIKRIPRSWRDDCILPVISNRLFDIRRGKFDDQCPRYG